MLFMEIIWTMLGVPLWFGGDIGKSLPKSRMLEIGGIVASSVISTLNRSKSGNVRENKWGWGLPTIVSGCFEMVALKRTFSSTILVR